jgi:hypothetical protein
MNCKICGEKMIEGDHTTTCLCPNHGVYYISGQWIISPFIKDNNTTHSALPSPTHKIQKVLKKR